MRIRRILSAEHLQTIKKIIPLKMPELVMAVQRSNLLLPMKTTIIKNKIDSTTIASVVLNDSILKSFSGASAEKMALKWQKMYEKRNESKQKTRPVKSTVIKAVEKKETDKLDLEIERIEAQIIRRLEWLTAYKPHQYKKSMENIKKCVDSILKHTTPHEII